MKSLTDSYKLANGVEIPCVGYGTLEEKDGDAAVNSVMEAIKVGYRHIDTAEAYENETSVGLGIKKSGIPRKDIFVASKLHNDLYGYKSTKAAFMDSLKKLGMDYLDLFLVHWPDPLKFRNSWEESNAESWRVIEELYKADHIRSIGISNFYPHHMTPCLRPQP